MEDIWENLERSGKYNDICRFKRDNSGNIRVKHIGLSYKVKWVWGKFRGKRLKIMVEKLVDKWGQNVDKFKSIKKRI